MPCNCVIHKSTSYRCHYYRLNVEQPCWNWNELVKLSAMKSKTIDITAIAAPTENWPGLLISHVINKWKWSMNITWTPAIHIDWDRQSLAFDGYAWISANRYTLSHSVASAISHVAWVGCLDLRNGKYGIGMECGDGDRAANSIILLRRVDGLRCR